MPGVNKLNALVAVFNKLCRLGDVCMYINVPQCFGNMRHEWVHFSHV